MRRTEKLQAVSCELRVLNFGQEATSCKLNTTSRSLKLINNGVIAISLQFMQLRSWFTACRSQLLTRSFWLLTFSFLFLSAHAQQVSAAIDRDKILLGEQITLQLKAENIRPEENPIIAWFNLPDTINHLEVVKRSAIDTLDVGSSTTYMQNIVVTSFDSGKWVLPPLQLHLQNNNAVLTTELFTIEVLPVDVSGLQQYHEMKDIIAVEVKTDWLRVFIFAAILIVAAVLIYYLTKRKKTVPVKKQPAVKPSLFEDTIAKLEALQKETLPATVFYARLDVICREYLQEQLHIRALHLTHDELMLQMNAYLQQQDARTSFYQLLRLMSAVKFAKYAPPAPQQTESINTAKATVQYIHHQLQRSQQHAQPLVSKY